MFFIGIRNSTLANSLYMGYTKGTTIFDDWIAV